jgi:hypothetical protein
MNIYKRAKTYLFRNKYAKLLAKDIQDKYYSEKEEYDKNKENIKIQVVSSEEGNQIVVTNTVQEIKK